ncbi:SRPBCC family protein [Epilithonimonas hungarica]|uniref:Activator of Hsp90 ATPase homolog 1-like protein n=1 Tax=Epilithonimonas hungarica TaxID=454006 RepID=A0A1G7JP85_9FLAO|nr:SRPBCC domain-containing protein [Epilithonimonas hungarica]SDF26760.1 Activator of Hsp90 ATPase homolog 1-like protein [Epilithonimonas hungarica]
MESNKNFEYSFHSNKIAKEIFPILKNVKSWWNGLFGEVILGESNQTGDEFSFSAGDDVHFSKQKLIELNPNKELVWLVTDSNLSFLQDTHEWENTKIKFILEETKNGTKVTFTHEGLIPKIECYKNCTGAWTQYLANLEKSLNS